MYRNKEGIVSKKEWLEQRVVVDRRGRPPSLADVPLTMMSRAEAFKKRDYSNSTIDSLWNKEKEKYNE